MPHPEREHELQIALATALRERDQMALRAEHFAARILDAESALAAARRECEGLKFAVEAARREREVMRTDNLRLRTALVDLIHEDGPSKQSWDRARAALTAPAAGEEGKR